MTVGHDSPVRVTFDRQVADNDPTATYLTYGTPLLNQVLPVG